MAIAIDQVLTKVILETPQQELIYKSLFPPVSVTRSENTLIRFDAASFEMIDTLCAPGAHIKEFSPSYSTEPIALRSHKLTAVVINETLEYHDSLAVPIDTKAAAVNDIMYQLMRNAEYEAAMLARNAANYDPSHTIDIVNAADKFDDPLSDPAAVVATGIERIMQSMGVDPNTLVIPGGVFSALIRHPNVQEQFKYTSSASINAEMLAQYFNVAKVVVGKAVYTVSGGAKQYIWGNDMILAYVPENIGSGVTPTYGFQPTLVGSPFVQPFYTDNSTNTFKANIFYDYRAYMPGPDAGYLIKNAI